MKVVSNKDPQAKELLSTVSVTIAAQAEVMGLPFWIVAEDSDPVGVIAMGREPIALLAPAGTPMAVIDLVDAKRPIASLKDFASEALRLTAENHAEYAVVTLDSGEAKAINCFVRVGFRELSDSYGMVLQLDREIDCPKSLDFKKAGRKEMLKWTELASEFLTGSPDEVLALMVENMSALPKSFLDMIYSMCEFYFVKKGQQTVGILEINVGDGKIVNIGVDPSLRGKRYGRQAVLFGLKLLKKAGCQQATLRVHVENKAAIRLYRSLGFTVKERQKTLMWRAHAFL
jgi:ribosomal protein S18 acetylase RimI-like enzyme